MKLSFTVLVMLRIVTTILLILCLFKMPYGYYQIVRLFATFAFFVFALNVSDSSQALFYKVINLTLAILFQPLFKIPLGRTIWNIVDIIVAIGLLVSIFIISRQKKISS